MKFVLTMFKRVDQTINIDADMEGEDIGTYRMPPLGNQRQYRYIVPHNIGHSNYIVNINPQWDTTAIASVVNTGVDSVEIAIVNYNGMAIDCSFHITMIG